MDLSTSDYRLIGEQINTNHMNWLSKNFYKTSGPYYQMWSDEANWTKYHAACWNALRNDNWTNMGFSPSAIASKNYFTQDNSGSNFNENDFFSATSAYTALIDMLTLGGIWTNPQLVFDLFHENPKDSSFSRKFIRFWLPMINQLMAWTYNSSAIENSHDFASYKIRNAFDLDLKQHDFDLDLKIKEPLTGSSRSSQMQEKWHTRPVGGNDGLHLSNHCLRPLQNGGDNFTPRDNYQQIYTDSYAYWGHGLLSVNKLNEPTLIRVSVKVHLSMEAHSCLGHFLLTPESTLGRHGKDFNVSIRYVNDIEALRMLNSGKFQVN
jgi:hypothetical protein